MELAASKTSVQLSRPKSGFADPGNGPVGKGPVPSALKIASELFWPEQLACYLQRRRNRSLSYGSVPWVCKSRLWSRQLDTCLRSRQLHLDLQQAFGKRPAANEPD